jgi:hypothetical protein
MLRCNNNSPRLAQNLAFYGFIKAAAPSLRRIRNGPGKATMAVYEIAPNRAGAPLARPVELICFALIVAQAIY